MAADDTTVLAQLERILESQALNGSDQLKRLLRHVVERTLHGQSEMLKEYNLGVEVFNRPPDYDPKTDPIVRVQARRLRAKLDEYYATEGAQEHLVIAIPKGAYVPTFEPRSAPSTVTARPVSRRWTAFVAASAVFAALVWMWLLRGASVYPAQTDGSIAVLPLRGFGDSNDRQIPEQATELLITQLAQSGRLRVLSRTTTERYRNTKSTLPDIARTLGARWVVEGGVGIEGTRAYLKLRAVDATTDRKVWADVFDCELTDLVPTTARAATAIAAAVEKARTH